MTQINWKHPIRKIAVFLRFSAYEPVMFPEKNKAANQLATSTSIMFFRHMKRLFQAMGTVSV